MKKNNNNNNITRRRKKSIRLICDQTPFAIRESFNQLRTNIMYTPNDSEGSPVYAITSAEMSVGKSTISANLALSFANADKKVLLIDADMRRPSQHRIFGYNRKQAGLSELIAGVKESDSDVICTPFPNLHLITSGIIPPNPSELLHSRKLAAYIAKWKTEYDIIFIDLPPVGIVTDPVTIADHVNGYVLVAMSNRSDARRINAAIKAIRATRARIIGIVINATSLRGDGKNKYGDRGYGYKRGYNYKYGYNYGYYDHNSSDND